MKTIMTCTCALLAFVWATSCTLLENKHQNERSRRDTESKDTSSTGTTPAITADTIIYTAGIRFRDGYDWRIDTLAANEPRELVLAKGEEIIASYPVGYEDAVSDDPDMHRIIDGHLYTDFSTDRKTIVKKDGQTLFSFDARESFCGFLVDGNDVWTLGKDRWEENLFSLRKNGDLVFSDTGSPFGMVSDPSGEHGALTMTASGPAFFYYKIVLGQEFKGIKFYRVVNTEATQITIPDNFNRIFDAKMVKGRPVIAGKTGTSRNILSLYYDNHIEQYQLTGFSSLGRCYIVPLANGSFTVNGEGYSGNSKTASGFIIEENREITYIQNDRRLIAFYEKDNVSVMVTSNPDGSAPVINKNGWNTNIDGRYCYISRRCGYIFGKRFYMAFNPLDKDTGPFVYGGDRRLELKYNGFITEVWPCEVSRLNR